jgi:hypothetical protein
MYKHRGLKIKKLLIASLVAGSLAASGTSLAARSGFYISGEVGYGKLEALKASNKFEAVKQRTGWGGRLAAGYLEPLVPSFSLGPELGYNYFHFNKKDGVERRQQAVDLLLVGQVNVNDHLYFLGKGGAAYVEQRAEGRPVKSGGTEDDNPRKFAPKLGVGVGVAFNKYIALEFNASHTFDADDKEVGAFNAATLGIKVSF